MDTVSRTKRSEIMRAVKSTGTKMELEFAKTLRSSGVRYRRNHGSMFGKPDFILPDARVVLFLDSCFWHGCRWHCRYPMTNRELWQKKIARNKLRDKLVGLHYRDSNWVLVRFWEHQIKRDSDACVEKIIALAKLRIP